jgi:hypothetical protein
MRAVSLLRRLLPRRKPRASAPPTPDRVGEHLRAAIAADTRAKADNVETYEARVKAMIDDLFSKYGDRGARDHL